MIKYNSNKFGITIAIFLMIFFTYLFIKSYITDDILIINIITPLIPIVTDISLSSLVFGLVGSFFWGYLLGVSFMFLFNFYNIRLNK
ncbi:MAG: hypothetical protein D8M61_17635 [Ignavibacteriae bacterium]|nr:hypothetical protein [Ignavibacteriota bacterium]